MLDLRSCSAISVSTKDSSGSFSLIVIITDHTTSEEVEKDVVEVGVVDDQTEEDWVQKL